MLAGVVGLWEDALAFGPALLLVANTIALASSPATFERSVPFVASGLVVIVDLGAWSLELRDGPEQQPLAHLRTLGALALGALGASALVLAVGTEVIAGGFGVWLIAVTAALAMFTLIRRSGLSVEPNATHDPGRHASSAEKHRA